jgi:hypothetical protein
MLAPVRGPPIIASNPTVSPTASPAAGAGDPVVGGHRHDHEHEEKRQHHFDDESTRQPHVGHRGGCLGVRAKQEPQEDRTGCRSGQLGQNVGYDVTPGKPAAEPETERYRRIEVRA